MATTAVSLSEYLDTIYHPDREYVDGAVLERNVGKNEHSRIQSLLAAWFIQHEETWGLAAFTEQRLRVSASRIRIPDVLLVPVKPHPEVFTEPPVLIAEILSPGDSYAETQARAQDYLRMGVPAIWVIDPAARTGRMWVGNDFEDEWKQLDRLEVPNTPVYVDLPRLFERMARTSPR